MYRKESCVIGNKLVRSCGDGRRTSLKEWYPRVCQQIEDLRKNNLLCGADKTWPMKKIDQLDNFDFEDFKATLTKYAKDNTAILTMFIREPFATRIKVDEDTSIIDAISNIGGIMGLCMGFSLVTLVEISYHIICLFYGCIVGKNEDDDGKFVGRRTKRLMKDEKEGIMDEVRKQNNILSVTGYM